jgi:RNA polymerase sigma factor (TIGR02999 family)
MQNGRLGQILSSFPPSSSQRYMDTAAGDITVLLQAWSQGDKQALSQLTPLVYRELYRAAQCCMAHQKPGHMLQSTALVNEVYLRLVKLSDVAWHDRKHFFAVCAQSMRHILTDYARGQLYQKRQRAAHYEFLDDRHQAPQSSAFDIIALDEALTHLAAFDERKSRVVELRYFGGLSVQETAEVLMISEATVSRDWIFAKD